MSEANLERHGALDVLRGVALLGRMAFTNYLAHSVIAVAVFNFGGLFGALERWQQLVFALCVWAAQLAWSAPWLARFHFGPVEWFWRALTYGRLPPWRRAPVGVIARADG